MIRYSTLEKISAEPSEVAEDPVKAAWEDVVLRRQSPSSPVRKLILTSWKRCLQLGLDPMIAHSPEVISGRKLALLRQSNRDLIEISRPVMKMVEISVRGTGFIVTLAEAGGHVLEVHGDSDVLAMA